MAQGAPLSAEAIRVRSIEEGRKRRASAVRASIERTEWFISEVSKHISLTMHQRVQIATELLKNKIIINISRPVTKVVKTNSAGQSRIVVRNRSKKGEFPKADTTLLMKTIFSSYAVPEEGVSDGYVGTPLDYGLELEISKSKDRSFLVRTLRAMEPKIVRILTGPIS